MKTIREFFGDTMHHYMFQCVLAGVLDFHQTKVLPAQATSSPTIYTMVFKKVFIGLGPTKVFIGLVPRKLIPGPVPKKAAVFGLPLTLLLLHSSRDANCKFSG